MEIENRPIEHVIDFRILISCYSRIRVIAVISSAYFDATLVPPASHLPFLLCRKRLTGSANRE